MKDSVHAPQVVYSANVRLGGGGMGSSLVQMIVGLHAANLLRQVIVSSYRPTPIPSGLITSQGLFGRALKRLAFLERTGWGDYLTNRQFDRWASWVMQPADIFESWTGFCLSSLKTAKKRGSHTFLGHGSAHPRTQLDLINAERRRWGVARMYETPLVHQIEQEFALADTIIIQSRFSERTLVERGIPAEKLVRIPLGVDVRRFAPAESRSSGPFRVLFVGQLTLRKGLQYLLEAWKQLHWNDAELLVVGQLMPDFKPVMKHYADLTGVRWVGHTSDPVAYYQQSDAFVMPSVEDGFGLVLTEAMACALPVIVSDHTGAADLVRDGENGWIVQYDQVEQYAAALQELRDHPAAARQMGQAARAIAVQQTWTCYRKNLVHVHRTE